ncbi:hypothetical protein NBRC116583_28040 [Arenicella sp. 4NH20-0111]|uniref:PepSY-associated TM helix domain-containing protein n=1 Tax=Arenicella sp. 4NH20-0111 TaxID=3127648 RepID=UPI00310A6B03
MKKIHRYLGLVLSLIVLIISVTGVMLVWKREYLWVTVPEARELRAEDVELSNVVALIQKSYSADELLFVRFYAEGLGVHKVYLSDRRYAWHSQQGEKVEQWKENERFEDWLLDLHHRLLLGNAAGLNMVGFTGLLLLPMMVIGLLIWWPWRKSFRLNLVPATGRAVDIKKGHFETGVSIIAPVMMIVITGIILVYPTESRWLLRDGFSDPLPPKTTATESFNLPEKVSWKRAFDVAEALFPEGKLHWVSFARPGSSRFSIGVQEAGSWNRMGSSSVSFDDSGAATVKRQDEQSMAEQGLSFAYPLHAGKLPTLYRLFISATGLLLMWLCFLGLLSSLKRKR